MQWIFSESMDRQLSKTVPIIAPRLLDQNLWLIEGQSKRPKKRGGLRKKNCHKFLEVFRPLRSEDLQDGNFFNPPQNSIWTKFGPLTFLMVIICFPKVNNVIPDRFLIFLSYQNDFLTLWEHKNVKNRPQNPLNTPYFSVLRSILVTFSVIPP